MNNSIKGSLYSGLVFPGLGQIILKHYKRGAFFVLATITLMFVTIVHIVLKVLDIVKHLDLENVTLDTDTISEITRSSDSTTTNILILLLTLVWIAGIVDAYILGKKKDKNTEV